MSRRREVVTRVGMVLALVLIIGTSVIWMRQSARPAAHMASALQIEQIPTVATVPPAQAIANSAPTERVDSQWAARIAQATGIPARAMLAYASADLTIDAEQPDCGLGWNTLAAIGGIESVHGTIGDRQLGTDGFSAPAIRGPALDGQGFAAIRDTEGGVWDGDTVWDRAVGPLQFIPSTWTKWAADGNGDGVTDPNQIDDAALATARYLCASGSVTGTQNWRAAVFSYNHLDTYVDDVAALANRYAAAG